MSSHGLSQNRQQGVRDVSLQGHFSTPRKVACHPSLPKPQAPSLKPKGTRLEQCNIANAMFAQISDGIPDGIPCEALVESCDTGESMPSRPSEPGYGGIKAPLSPG